MRLVADGLTIRRGGLTLHTDLSFEVSAGTALLVVGPNGSGKTTLLRALAGFIRPDAGQARLEGGAEEATLGEQAHYVGHANAIKSSLTVEENLRFWQDFLGGPIDSDALAPVRLSDLAHIPAAYLSAGQKRRLGLARLLSVRRPVWLLDEPTVSLDTESQTDIEMIINGHLADGGIAVIASHLPLALASSRRLDLAAHAMVDAT